MSGRGLTNRSGRPCPARCGLVYRDHENFTPRKIPAIRYIKHKGVWLVCKIYDIGQWAFPILTKVYGKYQQTTVVYSQSSLSTYVTPMLCTLHIHNFRNTKKLFQPHLLMPLVCLVTFLYHLLRMQSHH